MDLETDTDSEFDTRFSKYHCLFNDHSIQVTQSRVKEIRVKLKDELDVDDDCEEEKIHKLNFYTWIEYKLHNKETAREFNREVLQLTGSRNITSLLYQAFLLEKNGENMAADKCLDKVDDLKKGEDANLKNTEAKAELAYSYSRIGGARYISYAIDLYEEIVSKFPDEFTWKYRLGLAHRRATHGNISTTMPKWQPVKDHVEKAAKHLFEVARHCLDACLRARAFSQLAVMRNYCEPFVGPDIDRIFLDNGTGQLIDQALENGPNDSRTLAECGRILKFINLDKAIELLEKSMGIKKHSITLHHLGGCYVRKAVLNSKNQRPTQQEKSPEQDFLYYKKAHQSSGDIRHSSQVFEKKENKPHHRDQQIQSTIYTRNRSFVTESEKGSQKLVRSEQGRQTPVQFGQHRQTPVQFGQHRQTPVQFGQHRQTPVQFGQGRQTPVQFEQDRQTPVQFGQRRQTPVQFGQDRQTPVQFEQDRQTPVQFGQRRQTPVQFGQDRQTPVQFEQDRQTPVQFGQRRQTPVQFGQGRQTPVQFGQHRQTPVQFEQSKNTLNQLEQFRQTLVNFQQGKQTPTYFEAGIKTPTELEQGRHNSATFEHFRQSPFKIEHAKQILDQYGQDRQKSFQWEEDRQTLYLNKKDRQTPFQKDPHLFPSNSPQRCRNDRNIKRRNEFQNAQTPQRFYNYKGQTRKSQNQSTRIFRKNKLIKCPFKVSHLNKEDTFVTKAIDCFKESIQISFENNHPALYDLGLIYRTCGLYEEAVKQFDKIINGRGKGNDYFITVICAHEQCGLSLTDWAKSADENLSDLERQKLHKSSEKKLLKAVGLAAGLATLDPEIKKHAEEIWHSFHVLESRYNDDDESPTIIKKLILLLQVACKYEKIPAVIEKLKSLSETEISDWRVVKAALESYLALHEYESAFTFLSVSMTTPHHIHHNYELDCLKLKVQLCTAESRLQTDVAMAKFILKPVFDSIVNSQQTDLKDVHSKDDDYDDDNDVLILFDDKSPASDELKDKVCLLQKCISDIFGLEVSVNLEKCNSPGLNLDLQIKEMNRSKLLLVILEKSTPSNYFNYILGLVPCLSFEKIEASRQHVLLGLVDAEARIPPILKQYSHVSLYQELEHLTQIEFVDETNLEELYLKDKQINEIDSKTKSLTGPEGPVMNWSIDNQDIVTSLMKIYCSMIEKKWPL